MSLKKTIKVTKSWRDSLINLKHYGQFHVGMKVKIKNNELNDSVMIPVHCVKYEDMPNIFTIDEIFIDNLKDVWLRLRECCSAGLGCHAHPIDSFEKLTFIFR